MFLCSSPATWLTKTRVWFTQVPVVVALAATANSERVAKSRPQPLFCWLVRLAGWLYLHPHTHANWEPEWTCQPIVLFIQYPFFFLFILLNYYFFSLFSFVLNFRSPIHSSVHRAGRRANSTFTFIFKHLFFICIVTTLLTLWCSFLTALLFVCFVHLYFFILSSMRLYLFGPFH